MTTVEIEYCVPCGMAGRALTVQEAIVRQFGTHLDRCSLVMGDHGIFVVRVNGELIFDKEDDDFDVDAIVRRVRSQLRSP